MYFIKYKMKSHVKICSGGQTGVDIYALRLAYNNKFKTGGYVTHNYMTEFGPNVNELVKYCTTPIDNIGNLSKQYIERNKLNIIHSDLCIVFSLFNSVGTDLSKKIINQFNKDYIIIDNLNNVNINLIIENIIKKVKEIKTKYVINFIGHRESKLNDEQIEQIISIIQEILFGIK